jgi:hypothetical protein
MQQVVNAYIEFRVFDEARFQIFQRFYQALRQRVLNSHKAPTDLEDATYRSKTYGAPEEWMLLFRPHDLNVMGLPTHQESIRALKAWHGLTRSERRATINKNAALQLLADFADLLKRIDEAPFIPLECGKVGYDTARIEFSTDTPYFERETLEEMLLFFGFFNIVDESL